MKKQTEKTGISIYGIITSIANAWRGHEIGCGLGEKVLGLSPNSVAS